MNLALKLFLIASHGVAGAALALAKPDVLAAGLFFCTALGPFTDFN